MQRNEITTEVRVAAESPHGASVGKVKGPVAWLLFLVVALAVSNLMTLLHDGYHAAAHGMLKRMASVAGEPFAEALLKRSAMAVVEQKIEHATRRLARERDELRAKHADLDNMHQGLRKHHDALEAQLKRRVEFVRQFKARTLDRLVRHKAVELGSLVKTSIPYVGIATAVLATADELKSDCELLHDLNGLGNEHGLVPSGADTDRVCGFNVPRKEEIWARVLEGMGKAQRAVLEQLPGLRDMASTHSQTH